MKPFLEMVRDCAKTAMAANFTAPWRNFALCCARPAGWGLLRKHNPVPGPAQKIKFSRIWQNVTTFRPLSAFSVQNSHKQRGRQLLRAAAPLCAWVAGSCWSRRAGEMHSLWSPAAGPLNFWIRLIKAPLRLKMCHTCSGLLYPAGSLPTCQRHFARG